MQIANCCAQAAYNAPIMWESNFEVSFLIPMWQQFYIHNIHVANRKEIGAEKFSHLVDPSGDGLTLKRFGILRGEGGFLC